MQLARVIGTVVATVKSPGLEGVKLLVIQPLDRQQRPIGGQLVAADAIHMAGPGELVYFVAAREAAQAMPDPFVPVDHAIVGIVDAGAPPAGGAPAGAGGGRGAPAGAPARGRCWSSAGASGRWSRPSTPPISTTGRSSSATCSTPRGSPRGGYLIAVDTVGAGAGETVLILDEGTSARQVLGAPGAPIRTLVVGIVDAVTGGEPGASRAVTRSAAGTHSGPRAPRRRRDGGMRSDADHA